MRALLVMDMQEGLLGKNRDKKYNYDREKLIKNINGEINKFDKDNVFYIKTINKKNFINKIFSKNLYDTMPESKLVNNLCVVNKLFVEKDSNNVFKNKTFDERLKKAKIDEIQIVGIDTCS
ncbi:MAG: isochorismatase family protein, partial [Clostridia bacterium]|nr:isochorismatase family protein [Clostridia bacterium]